MDKKLGVFVIVFSLVFIFFNMNYVNSQIEEIKDNNDETYGVNVVISDPVYSNDALNVLKIDSVEQFGNDTENGIKIKYSFDNSEFIGDSVLVNLWLSSPDGSEILKQKDSFSIRRESPIEREVIMKISKYLAGLYTVFIQLDSSPSSVVKQQIKLEKIEKDEKKSSLVTGKTIFDQDGTKYITLGVFVIIIALVLFFVIKNHDGNVEGNKETKKPETPIKRVITPNNQLKSFKKIFK